MGDIATPPVGPSVCPSVTLSFCTVTRKCIAVFFKNFAGMCTMAIVFYVDVILFEFFMIFFVKKNYIFLRKVFEL